MNMAAPKGTWAQIIGTAGSDPETKGYGDGTKTLTKFRMVVPIDGGTKTDAGWQRSADLWYSVAVFSETLQPIVKAEVYKGAKVAIEGYVSARDYEGQTYYDIVANGVYLTQRLGGGKVHPERKSNDGEFPF